MLNATIAKVFPVNCTVTGFAERQAIGNDETQAREISPFFYVMSIQIMFTSTMLAGVIVSSVHGFTPLSYFGLLFLTFGFACTSFPSKVIRSTSGESGTFNRTGFTSIPFRLKGRFATETDTRLQSLRSLCPTGLRAEFRCFSSILLDQIRCLANCAGFRNASVFHISILTQSIRISENYCAFILERMATAFPDLEIKRIEAANAANG